MKQDFTSRMQQILMILLQTDQILSVQILAKQLGVSKRTIQRELEYLGSPLKKYHISFCSKTGAGVWLEGEARHLRYLLERLEDKSDLAGIDRTQRRKRLLLEILKDKDLKKLYYYSELFTVSKATISMDLGYLESWLSDYDLQITRTPGLGVSMKGSEPDFRRALRAFIDENIDTDMIQEYYDDRNDCLYHLVSDQTPKNIYSVLDREILNRVITCISRHKEPRIYALTENSYTGLIIHITIAVNRIMKQEIIEDNPQLLQQLSQDEDYYLAAEIVSRLEQEFSIFIPAVEVAYICLHIKGAKVQQSEAAQQSGESIEIMTLVHEMIDVFDPELAPILKQDDEFVINGLIAHLKPTLIRLANHMKIQNPLLEHVQTEYSEVYQKCKRVAQVIERRYGYLVPETEIGFIAIHFGAALVRLEEHKENKRKVYIGVVCASGIGISRLMLSKISRQFMERIHIRAYGHYEITPLLLEQLDFVISTTPLQEDIEILYVSPLLTLADLAEVEKKIYYYERLPKKQVIENEFTRQLEQINFIACQIKGLITGMRYLKTKADITFEALLAEIAQTIVPHHDLQQLIISDISKREQHGSQVFPEFGFALLHSRSKGVEKPVFFVVLPIDQGYFTNPYLKQIAAIIVMLLPDDHYTRENTALLGYLSETLVEENTFLDTLLAGNEENSRTSLAGYLKKYFNRYLDHL